MEGFKYIDGLIWQVGNPNEVDYGKLHGNAFERWGSFPIVNPAPKQTSFAPDGVYQYTEKNGGWVLTELEEIPDTVGIFVKMKDIFIQSYPLQDHQLAHLASYHYAVFTDVLCGSGKIQEKTEHTRFSWERDHIVFGARGIRYIWNHFYMSAQPHPF